MLKGTERVFVLFFGGKKGNENKLQKKKKIRSFSYFERNIANLEKRSDQHALTFISDE